MAPESINVTICGDGGCGKSSLTLRVVRGVWTHDYDPTIEDRYSVTRTVDGATYSMHLVDTAGQEEYRAVLLSSSANGQLSSTDETEPDSVGDSGILQASDAFLLVYSITSRASLEVLSLWERMVEREAARRRAAGLIWPGVMVVGNKCDLAAQREVSSREGLAWARARGYGFMETSARESVNVGETFSALVRRVVEARRLHATGQRQPSPTSQLISPGLRSTPLSPQQQHPQYAYQQHHHRTPNPHSPTYYNNYTAASQPASPALAHDADSAADVRLMSEKYRHDGHEGRYGEKHDFGNQGRGTAAAARRPVGRGLAEEMARQQQQGQLGGKGRRQALLGRLRCW